MAFFAAAFGLLLHIVFWGAGLAWLITPRPWRRYWPVFAPLVGVAFQSAVVWVGAHTNLRGTHAYAWWAELLPLGLLALAWKRDRQGWAAWKRVALVAVVAALTLGALITPFSWASKSLTTLSMGSCDAADYAAGARVLGEFSRSDRDGFIGLKEVVSVGPVDNFFDYWIRLNHFTPSAIVALNGVVMDLEPHQLISVATAVFYVVGVPIVFWLARAGFRYSAAGSLVVSLIYGFSPILWYAVAHAAMSQLLAAPALGLITWAGVALWRSGASWSRGWRLGGLLAAGYWIVLGSYNFMVTLCLVPVTAYAVGCALWRSDFPRLGRWALGMLVPLVLTSLAAYDRVSGLAARFQLFQQYDFGWRIPALSPEGWYGIIRGVNLMPYPEMGRWILSVALLAGWLAALVIGARRRRDGAYLALCLTGPILAGYAILELEGIAQGTNTSYDAYKLFAAFYPGILAALGYGLIALRGRRLWLRAAVAAAAVFVVAANMRTAYRFALRIETAPLRVDRSLARLQSIESSTEVKSLNLRIIDFWSRLWANSFLLHREQYFHSHTYEGRLNTEMKGDWDLLGGILSVRLPDQADPMPLEKPYSLVSTASPYYIRIFLGEGWYGSERLDAANQLWHWSRGDAELVFNNPHPHPVHVGFRIQARSLTPRDAQFWTAGQKRRVVNIGTELAWVNVPSIELPPGESKVQLRSSTPPQRASESDARLLGIAAYSIEAEVKKQGDPPDKELALNHG